MKYWIKLQPGVWIIELEEKQGAAMRMEDPVQTLVLKPEALIELTRFLEEMVK